MTKLGPMPEWIEFENASEAHVAAFAAHMHRDTQAKLVLLWFADGGFQWWLIDGACGVRAWSGIGIVHTEKTAPPFDWATRNLTTGS